MEPTGGHQPMGAAGHPTNHHLLVESLVLDPTLPEVFAGFWCRGKIGENNFLLLKEKDRKLRGRTGSRAHPTDEEWSRQSRKVALAWTDPALEPFGMQGSAWYSTWHEGWADGLHCPHLPLCSQLLGTARNTVFLKISC